MENKEKILGSFITQLITQLRANQRAIEAFFRELEGTAISGTEREILGRISTANTASAEALWLDALTYSLAASMANRPDHAVSEVASLINENAKARDVSSGHSVVSNAIWAVANQIGDNNREVMDELCQNLAAPKRKQ